MKTKLFIALLLSSSIFYQSCIKDNSADLVNTPSNSIITKNYLLSDSILSTTHDTLPTTYIHYPINKTIQLGFIQGQTSFIYNTDTFVYNTSSNDYGIINTAFPRINLIADTISISTWLSGVGTQNWKTLVGKLQ